MGMQYVRYFDHSSELMMCMDDGFEHYDDHVLKYMRQRKWWMAPEILEGEVSQMDWDNHGYDL